MSRIMLVATIVLSSACIPSIALAEDAVVAPAESQTKTEISKDAWLGQMGPILPDLICKGFMQDANLKKRFDELKMTYEQCIGYIPEISKKCQAQYYDKIPSKIDNESASTWGRTIGECIGKNYAEAYLIPR
ncbi:MAG: hypothetical protein WC627_04210 [Legionella sp.]|jgi:hypothetical protein